MKKIALFLFIIGIILLTISVRLFQIEKIPGEWYGDISNVHEYEMQVLNGDWPFYFFQSPGPLYHYLIAPIVLLYRNNGYETYKLASIIISLIGLIGTYLVVNELADRKIALIAVLTMSVSLWFLIWSRLGNSQIVIPALATFMSYFLVRFIKRNKTKDILLGGVISSLGWYTYPQTFILAPLYIFFISLYFLYRVICHRESRRYRRDVAIPPSGIASSSRQAGLLAMTVILMLVLFIPFINIVRSQPDNFSRGYVGEKIMPVFSMSIPKLIQKTLGNYLKTVLMLHVKGDGTFRVNVSNHPQIDKLSGVFFLLGFLYFAKRKRKIWLAFILFMLLVLPLPSISPAIPDGETPNSARTIAVIPFVFLLISAGFLWSYRVFTNNFYNRYKNYKYYTAIIFSAIFAYITFANLKLYFIDYTRGLPDENLGPGRIIANYIDKLPPKFYVYFSSCCWGAWGQPEPKGVVYQLHNQDRLTDFTKLREDCGEIKNRPAVVVSHPKREDLVEKFMKCSEDSKIMFLATAEKVPIANLIFVK